MPLFTDHFSFSEPWQFLQPGGKINYDYRLKSALKFNLKMQNTDAAMSFEWGKPIAETSKSVIEIDTRNVGVSFQTAGFNRKNDVSSMCVHAKSPFNLMEQVKFRLSVSHVSLPESFAFGGNDSLVKVRIDATQDVTSSGQVEYRHGDEFNLSDICTAVKVSNTPLQWHSSWSECIIDLGRINDYRSSSTPWDSVCFQVRPGVRILVDQIAAELRGVFENEIGYDKSSPQIGKMTPIDTEDHVSEMLNEFLFENGLAMVNGMIVVVSEKAPELSPPPPYQQTLTMFENSGTVDYELMEFLSARGLTLDQSGKIVTMPPIGREIPPSRFAPPPPPTPLRFQSSNSFTTNFPTPNTSTQNFPTPNPSSQNYPTSSSSSIVSGLNPSGLTGYECWITQEACRLQPGTYEGTFRDYMGETLFNASLSSSACAQRAEDYYTWCGNDNVDRPTTSTHYPSKRSKSFPEAGCFVTIDFCVANPAISGNRFRDYWAENTLNADVDQSACLRRAEDFFYSCGGDPHLVKVKAMFRPTGKTSTYPREGTEEIGNASITLAVEDDDYECHIIQSQCRVGGEAYEGSFVETKRDQSCMQLKSFSQRQTCDQTTCLARARQWHEWCKNPSNVQTTAWHKESSWFITYPEVGTIQQTNLGNLAQSNDSRPSFPRPNTPSSPTQSDSGSRVVGPDTNADSSAPPSTSWWRWWRNPMHAWWGYLINLHHRRHRDD